MAVRGRQIPSAQILRPVIDMYRNSAVALTGCHSQGLQRDSCELDVIVVTSEKRPRSSARIGGVFVDLFFADEREVLKPTNPEHAVSMAHAKTLRDTSLILSTSSASNTAVLGDSARRSSRRRLASALKALGRVDDALSKDSVRDADFWLLSASYDFAYAVLYSREALPAPSHLLSQLKEQTKGLAKNFEVFTRGAGLEKSSRANCGSRLEGIAVLHDVLGGAHVRPAAGQSDWTGTRSEIVSAKANELNARIEHAECYSFLGQETVNAVLALTTRSAPEQRRGPKGSLVVSALSSEKEGLLSGRIFRELGLSRERDAIEESLHTVRDQLSRLARRA